MKKHKTYDLSQYERKHETREELQKELALRQQDLAVVLLAFRKYITEKDTCKLEEATETLNKLITEQVEQLKEERLKTENNAPKTEVEK